MRRAKFSRLKPLLGLFFVLIATLPVTLAGGSPASADGGAEPPARPTGLQADTEPGSLDVSLDWDDVGGATHYWVRWRVAGPGNTLNEGVEVEVSEAIITVADYGEWVARVQACNDADCGKPITLRGCSQSCHA